MMKMNRWFPVTLFVGALTLATLSFTAAFSDDDVTPEHSHETDSPHGEAHKPDEAKMKAALARLPEADRLAAAEQRYCPMMDTVRLGAMGTPIKVRIDGKPVFLCCSGCKADAVDNGKETLAKVEKLKKATAAIAKLPAADQLLAEAQLFCPIEEGSRLGSMGTPFKLMLDSQPIFLCCKGCVDSARENSEATLAKVEEIKHQNAKAAHHEGDGHEHSADEHKHGAHEHGAAAREHKKPTVPKVRRSTVPK